jgi:hypothetical protein
VPKAHIRNGELTIPHSDEIRKKLGLLDGDELEEHVFPREARAPVDSGECPRARWGTDLCDHRRGAPDALSRRSSRSSRRRTRSSGT